MLPKLSPMPVSLKQEAGSNPSSARRFSFLAPFSLWSPSKPPMPRAASLDSWREGAENRGQLAFAVHTILELMELNHQEEQAFKRLDLPEEYKRDQEYRILNRKEKYHEIYELLNEAQTNCVRSTDLLSSDKYTRPGLLPALSATTNILNETHIASLQTLKDNHQLKGCILLVDDQFMMMKLLFRNVSTALNGTAVTFLQESKNWKKYAMTQTVIADWGIICASDGAVAQEVLKYIPVDLMVTDQMMPGVKGLELILSVRMKELETYQETPMQIALHTSGGSEAENQVFQQRSRALRTCYIDKSSPDRLTTFINEGVLSILSKRSSPLEDQDQVMNYQELFSL